MTFVLFSTFLLYNYLISLVCYTMGFGVAALLIHVLRDWITFDITGNKKNHYFILSRVLIVFSIVRFACWSYF